MNTGGGHLRIGLDVDPELSSSELEVRTGTNFVPIALGTKTQIGKARCHHALVEHDYMLWKNALCRGRSCLRSRPIEKVSSNEAICFDMLMRLKGSADRRFRTAASNRLVT